MNTHFHSPALPRTTQAAEGLMRRRWSVAEIEAMVEAGVIIEDERFELIGGEAVPMSPKGNRHELLKVALIEFWVKRMLDGLRLAPETTFRLDEDTFLEPDFIFYRTADGLLISNRRTPFWPSKSPIPASATISDAKHCFTPNSPSASCG